EINTDGGSYTVNDAPAGTYTITITDGNGCVATTSTQISEPVGLTASATTTPVLCNGGASGSIEGTATGGTAPYNMSWTGPNTGNPAGDEINTDGGSYAVNGAPAGSYVITMTDGNGCSATTTSTIMEPAILQINATPVPPLCNGVFNGSMDITAIGGTAPYNVSWSGPTSDDPIGTEIPLDGGLYAISGLGSGTYNVTLTDTYGCTTNTSVSLVPPAALTMQFLASNVSCSGASNGSIQVTATDGTEPYNVIWTGTASGDPTGTEINASGGNFSITNLSAGAYTVFVTDNNGCLDSNIIQLTEPSPLGSTDVLNNPLCQNAQDGSITITANGGSPGYNVTLGGPSSSDPVGLEIVNSGESYSFSNLGVGNYTLTITDNNSCQLSYPVQLSASNTPPVVTILSDTICFGQSTQLTAVGTPAGGTFLWNNNVQINTITVQPNVTTSYSVLYNYNGCLAQGTATIVVNPIPTFTLSDASTCEGGSVTLSPTALVPAGGSFLWSTNSTSANITVSPVATSNYSLIYSVNGCSSSPVSATVTIIPVPEISVQDVSICEGETATLTAVPDLLGGTYLWSPNPLTTSSISIAPLATTTYSVIYSLNGCSSVSESAQVIVNSIPSVSFDASSLTGCAPANISLWNTAGSAQNTTFQWTVDGVPSSTQDTMTFTFGPGCHTIGLSLVENGCIGSSVMTNFICIDAPPVAAFSASPSFFSQPTQTITFQNNSSGAQNYIWQAGDGTFTYTEDMVHEYMGTSQGYTVGLVAISALGCSDSSFLTLMYQDGIIVYIPNTFTPDGNNFNQQFLPIFSSGIDPNNYSLSIYNRWGELIFQSLNPEVGWDGSYGYFGRDCQQGTYTYKITVKIPTEDNYKVFTGHLNLLR
ncbi:MAG: hypothetical protein EBV15_05260, partial [Bacteroidetes bacterium]|nr:hypothetical protein [Bacteroidota bacterium]